MSENFERNQFAKELNSEVLALAAAEEDGASKEEKFTEYCLDILSEAGETEGPRICSYIKENRHENVEMKLNAFAISDGFESVDLFVSFYRDSSEVYALKKPEFDGLMNAAKRFVNAALKKHLDGLEQSSTVYRFLEELKSNRSDIIRVNIFLLSNGVIGFDVPVKIDLKGIDDVLIQAHVWDLDRFHRLNQSKSGREPITIDFAKTLGVSIPCLAMPALEQDYSCYLAIVPGEVLATLYRNYGTRLLESNVRAFLQQTGKVNKGIRDTIIHEPGMFLPYNNGLAATALNAVVEKGPDGSDILTSVQDFQIVNGGQTTASLFHTQKKHKVALDHVFVQMKLTVVKEEDAKNKIVPAISRYANSQNKVSELDLTSNSPLLQHLEELAQTTYATDPFDHNKQTLWFFERVKGQYKELEKKEPTKTRQAAWKGKRPLNQKIIKSDVAKYSNVYLQLPYHVAKGAQKNYVRFLEKAEADFKVRKPGRTYWEDVVANAVLFKEAERLFGRKNSNPIGDTNIRSYCVAYALSFLHHCTQGRIDLSEIWKSQSVPEPLSAEIRKGLVHVYDFFTSLDVSLISEAAKSEKTWKALLETKSPFDLEVLSEFLATAAEIKKRTSQDDSDLEEQKRYSNLEEIQALGLRFWEGLLNYNAETQILTTPQVNFVYRIVTNLTNGKAFTDAEIRKGLKIKGFILDDQQIKMEDIQALSSRTETEGYDVSEAFNRLARISNDDWARALDLGEQRNVLTYTQISVLKTVRNKISKSQVVAPKMLKESLDYFKKLERFGVRI